MLSIVLTGLWLQSLVDENINAAIVMKAEKLTDPIPGHTRVSAAGL